MSDAYATLREMLANVPDDAQVYVEELESIVEWPGITAGTFRQLLAEIAGFEAMWEQREKAHDAETEALRAQLATAKREALVPCRECAGSGLVPATPSGEGVPSCNGCGRKQGHGACECATPSPEAREVPFPARFLVLDHDGKCIGYVPMGCTEARQVVAMAQEAE
jgi:hypothetical protein